MQHLQIKLQARGVRFATWVVTAKRRSRMSRYVYLSIREDEDEKMEKIAVALSSNTRRDILRVVNDLSYNISEIAQKLDLPISTVAFHVKHLKKAGLVSVQERMMTRGVEKVVSHTVNEIVLNCTMARQTSETTSTKFQIPIGSYADCKVARTCGMASAEKMIGIDDTPSMFYSTERSEAQLIWLAKGYLEYRIPNHYLANQEATELLFSVELCSEAPNYRNEWASDITFWVNGYELCTWTSPGDFGGRRGRLNPDWWLDISTQYGMLKNVRINERGIYLDEKKMSSMKISELHLEEGDYFTIRIGVKADAQNVGGFNIFGEKFGDYEQAINVRIEHRTKKREE